MFTSLALLPAPVSAQFWSPEPTISWNTYLGGGPLPDGGTTVNVHDRIEAMAIGPAEGDVYVVGWTDALTFPASPGEGLPEATSRKDVFVARYSGDGTTLRWAKVFGGTGDDVATGVAVTNGGVVFVVGRTDSNSIKVSSTEEAPLISGYGRQTNTDGFLARLEPNGMVDYFMYLGSPLYDEAQAIALSADQGIAYVVGRTGRNDGAASTVNSAFPPGNLQSNERSGGYEAFVSQVTVGTAGAAAVQWTRILRSPKDDAAYSVSVQGDTVFVGGIAGAELISNPPATWVRTTFQGTKNEGFAARLQSNGSVYWIRYLGDSEDDDVRSVLARPGADAGVAVVGNTTSVISSPSNSTDAYVIRLDGEGFPVGTLVRLMVTSNGNERTEGHSAMDPYGNIYVGGWTSSSSGFELNGFDSTFGGPRDGFIAMVDSAVTGPVLASYVGGDATSEEAVQAVAAGVGGQVVFGGYSSAPNWLYSRSGLDVTANAGTDGFLMRMVVDTTDPTAGTVSAQLSNGRLTASWQGFADGETPLTYEWGISLSNQTQLSPGVRGYEFVGERTSITLDGFLPESEGPYFVFVRATNAAGRSTVAASNSLVAPPRPDAGTDGGTSDGGSDGGTSDGGTDGGTSDGGVDAGSGDGGTGEDDGDERSPLGWSCASSGGSGSLALSVLLVMLVLRAMRRERLSEARQRAPGSRR
ncbi:hypothetical protein ACLESO_49390 [Pyxidicoccus sp. 3LG]